MIMLRVNRRACTMRCAFTFVETAILLDSLVLVGLVGSSLHRWLWAQTELLRYRAAMQELTMTVRSMQFQADAHHRRLELRVDASQRRLQMVEVQPTPGGLVEAVRQTVWLPEGLEITESPTVLRTPSDHRVSIMIPAPAYNRVFQLTTSLSDGVQLHEEQTL